MMVGKVRTFVKAGPAFGDPCFFVGFLPFSEVGAGLWAPSGRTLEFVSVDRLVTAVAYLEVGAYVRLVLPHFLNL